MEWEVLAHGYRLAEAPTIDGDGSLVFSDVLGGGVYRLDDSGAVLDALLPLVRRVVGEHLAGELAQLFLLRGECEVHDLPFSARAACRGRPSR